ncbi:MAG TPA: hypothetical protein VE548_13920 [Nitrososphaeraceae archaeon]|nr:hypothetical protein [Nitrososphaeraceae archaeon]
MSEDKNIIANTPINQIVKAYINWHRMAVHAKLYYLPKSFLTKLVNELTEGELNDLTPKIAKNDLVDISFFLGVGLQSLPFQISQELG